MIVRTAASSLSTARRMRSISVDAGDGDEDWTMVALPRMDYLTLDGPRGKKFLRRFASLSDREVGAAFLAHRRAEPSRKGSSWPALPPAGRSCGRAAQECQLWV